MTDADEGRGDDDWGEAGRGVASLYRVFSDDPDNFQVMQELNTESALVAYCEEHDLTILEGEVTGNSPVVDSVYVRSKDGTGRSVTAELSTLGPIV